MSLLVTKKRWLSSQFKKKSVLSVVSLDLHRRMTTGRRQRPLNSFKDCFACQSVQSPPNSTFRADGSSLRDHRKLQSATLFRRSRGPVDHTQFCESPVRHVLQTMVDHFC